MLSSVQRYELALAAACAAVCDGLGDWRSALARHATGAGEEFTAQVVVDPADLVREGSLRGSGDRDSRCTIVDAGELGGRQDAVLVRAARAIRLVLRHAACGESFCGQVVANVRRELL
jgi:hypothetical protein